MRTKLSILIALIALIGALSCSSLDPIQPGAVNTGSLNFARFYAVGNSLTAGVQNGGLVSGFQQVSIVAMIADAAGAAPPAQPTISEPGIPPLRYVSNFAGPVITQYPTMGAPTNTTYPGIYNNLGIPGATLNEILTRSPTGAGDMFDIVLRDPATLGPTAVAQAAAAQPTVLTVWAGANDILGSATMGTDALATDPASFASDYASMMDTFVGAADNVIAANLPDIVTVPFFTTIPPVVVDPATREPVIVGGAPVPLIGIVQGSPAQLTFNDLVLLTASDSLRVGTGIPVPIGGNGRPLPDFMVLDATEIVSLRGTLSSFNTTIDTVCTARNIPVVDIYRLFNDVRANGVTLHGDDFTTDFLTGGVFGVDGIHPSSLGYWVVANEFIKTMNAAFGASIPEPLLPQGPYRPIDPSTVGTVTSKAGLAAALNGRMTDFRGLWRMVGVPEAEIARVLGE